MRLRVAGLTVDYDEVWSVTNVKRLPALRPIVRSLVQKDKLANVFDDDHELQTEAASVRVQLCSRCTRPARASCACALRIAGIQQVSGAVRARPCIGGKSRVGLSGDA